MKQAARMAQAILDLYESGKVSWCQGTVGSVKDGAMCLLGAEFYVASGNPNGFEYPEGSTPFRSCFKSRQPAYAATTHVWLFNDAKGRKYKHIRAALKKIIAAGKL